MFVPYRCGEIRTIKMLISYKFSRFIKMQAIMPDSTLLIIRFDVVCSIAKIM